MTGESTVDPRGAGVPVTGQSRRLALGGVRGPAAEGRAFTRRTLREWGWDRHESAADALLVVSELVTNAAAYANGCQELVLTAAERTLRIDVFDASAELPHPRTEFRPEAPGGHGLRIVRLLTDRWGSYTRDSGKVVWAEIEAVGHRDPTATATPPAPEPVLRPASATQALPPAPVPVRH